MASETKGTAVVTDPPNAPAIVAGFGNSASFEFAQRAAQALAASTLVPETYRRFVEKKIPGTSDTKMVENHSAVANCVIALNMAHRMGADPLMVMQNLYVVEGRPSWSAQFVIAAINSCGRFSPLRFDLSEEGPEQEVEYERMRWVNKQRVSEKVKVKIRNRTCRAWAIEKATGQRLDGPEVSIAMAVAEQWLTKSGSKWLTMPEMMLRYRAGSFFGKLYAPELLMGIQTQDEIEDSIIDVTATESGRLPPPPPPTRDQYRAAATDGPGDAETVDPETGEVTGGGQDGQQSLGLGDKPINYEIAVPTRKGADGKPQPDWLGWVERVREALASVGSLAEVQTLRDKNRGTMTDLFKADEPLAHELLGNMADREADFGESGNREE